MKQIRSKIQTGLLAIVMIGLSNLSFSQNKSFQKISDKIEITEHISKFSHTRDELDMEGTLNLFTNDATIKWIDGNGKEEFFWKGREGLREGFNGYFDKAKNMKIPFKENGFDTRHIQSNTIFLDLTQNTAKTKTAILVTWVYNSKKTGRKNKPKTIYQGYYEDEFIKIDGAWKIKNRKVITNN